MKGLLDRFRRRRSERKRLTQMQLAAATPANHAAQTASQQYDPLLDPLNPLNPLSPFSPLNDLGHSDTVTTSSVERPAESSFDSGFSGGESGGAGGGASYDSGDLGGSGSFD